MHNATILRFITAGSVDDGKSTLIGRLLYDSKNILSDHLAAIENSSRSGEEGDINLALLTDGLRAEREQGITIDVAYKYFETPFRKFIIADAPGHIQYTRNMITGASNSDLIIILIDARHGIIEQTRRHSIIASLLRIPRVVVAINKMDMVNFSETVFIAIQQEYESLRRSLGLPEPVYIPISALDGDNVVNRSTRSPWYDGPSLLHHLESVDTSTNSPALPRFQVQVVIRPQTGDLHDYRGYAGRIIAGEFRAGDEVVVHPSGHRSRIDRIEIGGKAVPFAFSPQSATILLSDDIDVSRGSTLYPAEQAPVITQEIPAILCWLSEQPLTAGNTYLLQHHSSVARARIREVSYKIDVNTLDHRSGEAGLTLNELARVTIRTALPVAYDPYEQQPAFGGAILVDETTNATVAAVIFQPQDA